MNPYQLALKYAADAGRDFYVNRVSLSRDEEILLVEPHKDRLCCAIAHPDGKLEYVVQGYSHPVAMTARTLAVLLVAVLCSAFQPEARAGDLWTAHKLLHLTGSAALAGVATDYTGSEWEGAGIAFSAGLAKEGLDAYRRRHRNGHDMFTCDALIADAIGAAIGAKMGGIYLERQSHGVQVAYSTNF
jgi:hypothetical protein